MSGSWRDRCGRLLPHLVIWPPILVSCGYVLVFSAWTVWVSFTRSTLMPDYRLGGLAQLCVDAGTRNWHIAYTNLFIYGTCFVVFTMRAGTAAGGADRPAHPWGEHLSHDFPVSAGGFLRGHRHGLGLAAQPEHRRAEAGARPRLDQLPLRLADRSATWRSTPSSLPASGRHPASPWRCCLAGLRSVDADLLKAAQIDGAGPARTYLRVVFPAIGPIFIAVLVMLLQFAIKTYDLVVALTAGGPALPPPADGRRVRLHVPAQRTRRAVRPRR